MEALTPASPGDLPPLGELVADEPFWRHPAWGLAREGVAHLRIWATATDPPGHVAVVTETGLGAHDDVVLAERVQMFPDLALPAPGQRAEGPGALDGIADVPDALVGPVQQAHVTAHR